MGGRRGGRGFSGNGPTFTRPPPAFPEKYAAAAAINGKSLYRSVRPRSQVINGNASGGGSAPWNYFVSNSDSNTAYDKTVGKNKKSILPLKRYYMTIYGLSHSEKRRESA